MTDDLPTADALAVALRALSDQVFRQDRRLLLAQVRRPERTVSCNALRALTGRESCVDTRLAYGRLARRIGQEAGWKPPRKGVTWTSALSETLPEEVEDEGVRWRMRPAAAEALVLAGWTAADPTTDTGRLQRSVDDLTRLVLFLTEEIAEVRADAAVLRRMLVKPTTTFGTSEKDWNAWFASPESIAERCTRLRAEQRAMSNDVEVLLDHLFSDL